MSFSEAITIAAHHALNDSRELHSNMVTNTIVSEACLLSGLESDQIGCIHLD